MKNITLGALAASFAIFPVQAQEQDYTNYETVVVGGRSVDEFVEDVSHDLDRQINRRSLRSNQMQETGVVQVLFECGPDGKPTNITMYNKSGPGIDRLARKAVSGIRSLHPLPQGVANDQLYLANIIIANDSRQFDKLSNELNQREQQRIAAAKGDRKVFAFTLSKSPST